MARCGKCGEPTYSYIPICDGCCFGRDSVLDEEYPVHDDDDMMEDYT